MELDLSFQKLVLTENAITPPRPVREQGYLLEGEGKREQEKKEEP